MIILVKRGPLAPLYPIFFGRSIFKFFNKCLHIRLGLSITIYLVFLFVVCTRICCLATCLSVSLLCIVLYVCTFVNPYFCSLICYYICLLVSYNYAWSVACLVSTYIYVLLSVRQFIRTSECVCLFVCLYRQRDVGIPVY